MDLYKMQQAGNGQAPIDMFINIYGKHIATLPGLEKIEPASIYLRPDLLK